MSKAVDELDPSLADSIAVYAAGGYAVTQTVAARCNCGGRVFELLFNDEVGVAARICEACEAEAGMLDSEEHFDDVDEMDVATCPCGGQRFQVAVGFSFTKSGEVRWVSVGLLCEQDGMAGVYTDWKIDYEPTQHLLCAV